MITASTVPPTNAERLAAYYAALPGSPDFHPAAHAARSALGLRIQQRALAGRSSRGLRGGTPRVSLRPGRAGCEHPALPLEHTDVTDPRDPTAAL